MATPDSSDYFAGAMVGIVVGIVVFLTAALAGAPLPGLIFGLILTLVTTAIFARIFATNPPTIDQTTDTRFTFWSQALEFIGWGCVLGCTPVLLLGVGIAIAIFAG